jgi:hypothetical protein
MQDVKHAGVITLYVLLLLQLGIMRTNLGIRTVDTKKRRKRTKLSMNGK